MIGLIVILCIIVITTIFVIVVICFEVNNIDAKSCIITSIILITFTCIISLITNLSHIEKPTAIDVYRGKTTLEITYKDNVPIDSVVVFK